MVDDESRARMSRWKRWGPLTKGIALGVFAVWAVFLVVFLMVTALWGFTPEEAGVFGDWFGALNALFSGLALAGVVVTLVMQSVELELQRDEIHLTRAEVRRSAEAAEAQASTMSLTAQLSALTAKGDLASARLRTLMEAKDAKVAGGRDGLKAYDGHPALVVVSQIDAYMAEIDTLLAGVKSYGEAPEDS